MSRSPTAPSRAREYETIYILRPDVDADNAERLNARVAEIVTREKGRLTKVESWGRRRLAYDIAKQKRGVYMYLRYLGMGNVVAELERNLRLSDLVLKYQTVLLRPDVETAAVEVSDDDVKFERLELPTEDEREESRERQLGLVEPERRVEVEPEPIEEAADEDAEAK
jgi:small subunit ribosomal protein S6